MKTKEQIVDLLISQFNYVYCDTCKYDMAEESCEGCHRKSMFWSLNPHIAELIADEILKDFD